MMKLHAADGHQFQAYEAGNVNAPRALVVVQEIFGVNAHMRAVCERLAQHGYHVLSPALFDRVRPNVELGYDKTDVEAGRALRAQIAEEAVLQDISATALALGNKPIGMIGYCWGGTLAWLGATRTSHFRAACGWYGAGIAVTRQEVPHCPVQLHFGALDQSIPQADIDAIRKAQPELEIFVYPEADHGFGCEARASYNPQANELAELRSLAFFAEHLR